MAFNFDVSILNPLRFFQLSDNLGANTQNINFATFDANYQTRQFDSDFFARNIPNYDRQTTYCQPFQQGDTLRVQFLGLEDDGTTNEYLLSIVNLQGQAIFTVNAVQGSIISGQYITEFSVPLFNIPEGEYFVTIRYRKLVGISYEYTYLISEPIHVAQSHPNTLLYEYSNSYNTQGIIFEELSDPFHFRVHSALTELNPDSKFTTYEDEPLNLEMLSGTPYRLWTLGIGGAGNPIPQWVADKIERITLCDTLKIDGKLYTRNEGAKLEANRKQRTPLFSWKLTLREKVNDNNLYIADYQANKVITATVVSDAGTIYAHDINTVASTYPIRGYFNGYTGLLQYLNGYYKVYVNLGGTFGIDAQNRLVYTPSSSAEATDFATASLTILPYTLELQVEGTAFQLQLTPSGTTKYAVQYVNNGAITYNSSTSPITLSNTYTAGTKNSFRVAVDSVQQYKLLSATTASITEVGGYLASNCVTFDFSGELVSNFTNNIFQFLGSAFATLNLSTTSITQTDIDNILKWFFLNNSVGSPTLNLLQTPDVPCSEQVRTNIVPYLLARNFILYLNNQFTPAAPVNIALPTITGTFNAGFYITCSSGSWTGYPTPYFARVWQYSTNGGSTWNNFSPSETGSQYLVQSGDVGRLIRCNVTATNPSGVATATSNSVLIVAIAGSAPFPTILPSISGTTLVGSVLTTTDGTWGGATPITYAYQWLRNGVAISGATSSTYTSVSADAGQNIQCQVLATNANGANNAESNIILPTIAPSNTLLPLVYGTTASGSVLTAYSGVWSGYPAPSFTYNWQRSTNGGVSYTNLGVTTQTYTLVSGDLGNLVRCQVTANNGVSPNATANSSGTSIPTVITQRPDNTVAPVVSGTPSIGQTLSTTNGTWSNTPTSYAYQWLRSGSAISGATSSTYTLVTADTNLLITCRVTATNSGGSESANGNDVFAYDSDFYAVITYATAQSFTLPTTAQLQKFSQMVKELKDNSMWTIMDRFWWMANNGSSDFGRINWVNPSTGTLLTLVNSPTWTSNVGFISTGTSYLDTQYNPSTQGVNYTLNNAGRYCYITQRATASGQINIDGANTNTNRNVMYVATGQNNHHINQDTNTGSGINTSCEGYHCITRTGASVSQRSTDLSQSLNIASTSIFNGNQHIMRSAQVAAIAGNGYGFYAIGGAIPIGDLATHRSIIKKYITNL